MTYADYLIKVTDTMKIRSTNYRESQNDITLLLNNVYEEIALECALEFIEQKVLIDSVTYEYDLQALYTTVANEVPLDVLKIEDDEGYDVSRFFRETKNHVFTVENHIYDNINDAFLSEYDTRYITFLRRVVPDIETLTYKQQMIIFKAILDGIMYYTHTALPNPTASDTPHQESTSYYKIYRASIDMLKNQFPQV